MSKMVTSYLSEFIQENTDSGRRSFARPLQRLHKLYFGIQCLCIRRSKVGVDISVDVINSDKHTPFLLSWQPLLRYMLHPQDVECSGTGDKSSLKLQFIHVGLRHI